MSRWIAIAAGIVVLLIAAIVAAPLLIPTHVYKQQLVSLVKSQTGRDLLIGGDVGLSFFPRLAVKVEDVRFSNAAWGKTPDMVSMKEMRAALKIMPLFRGEVEIDSFVFVDPVINLEVKADGTPNWQFQTAPKTTQAPAPAKSAQPTSPGGAPSMQVHQIRLGDVSIKNGAATYRNAQTGASLAFEKVNLDLAMPSLDEPFDATGSFVWNSEPLKLSLNATRPRALTEGGATDVKFSLTSGKINAAYQGSIQPLEGMAFSGGVDLNVASVRELARWLGNPLPAGSGFGPLSIQGKAQGSGGNYTFTDAKIGLDGMNAAGKLAVQTGGKRPVIKGDLAFERIDANTYLAPTGEAAAPTPTPVGKTATEAEAPGGWSNDPINLDGLRAADADISLSTKELLVKKIKVGESALDLKLAGGILTIDLTKIALYDGGGSGTLTLDGSGRVPGATASISIAGIAARQLLTDAADFKRLDGLAAISFAVDMSGRSQREMISALAGKGEVKFTNGAIKGVNIAQLARTVFQGPATGWQSGGGQDTDFSELGGTFTITNGILTNNDLKLLSPLLRVSGAGTVDMPHKSLDYRVEPKLTASLQGQGGTDAQGLEIPIIVDGPWAAPRFRPDLQSMLKNPQQTIEQVKGLKGGGKEMLKGLLGTGTPKEEATTPSGTAAPEGTQATPEEQSKPEDSLKKLLGR